MAVEAEGHVYADEDYTGEKFTVCDDFTLYWRGGGEIAEKNVANMDKAREAYMEALEDRAVRHRD
jgi:hypothetical protein